MIKLHTGNSHQVISPKWIYMLNLRKWSKSSPTEISWKLISTQVNRPLTVLNRVWQTHPLQGHSQESTKFQRESVRFHVLLSAAKDGSPSSHIEYGGQPSPPSAQSREAHRSVQDHWRSHIKPEKENEAVPWGLGHCWVLKLAGSQPNWSLLECDSSLGPESQDSTCCPLTKGPSPSVQFSHSVVSNSYDLMDCSTPGFPVHHQLTELTQTQVHWDSDAIQPSHPLSSPSSAFHRSQLQGLF